MTMRFLFLKCQGYRLEESGEFYKPVIDIKAGPVLEGKESSLSFYREDQFQAQVFELAFFLLNSSRDNQKRRRIKLTSRRPCIFLAPSSVMPQK